MRKEISSDVLLLCVAVIWGMNFVVMKFLLSEISPVNLILFRFITGSVLLFLLLFFLEDVKMPFRDFLHLSCLGAIGITVYQFFFTYALKYTSATNVSIIINTAPLYGGILSSLLGYEAFRKKKLFAIVVGFVGVYIIITKGSLSFAGSDMRGNVLAIVGSIFWALYTILSKPVLDRHSPLKVTAYSMVAGSVMLFPFVPFYLRIDEFRALSAASWVLLSFTVVFSVVIAFFLWYRGVSKLGPSRTIIYQYSVPVFAALFAILFLDEKLYFSQCFGAAIVFFSIGLARRS